MRNYIILNGTNSNTITGLLIQSLAPISKPLMRTEIEEIDGRDGDIITPLGFSAYDKQITIGLYGTYDINAIIAFFNSEGTVTFSNEPDKYYNYQIYDQIDFERLVRFKTATVTLHCQPFKFATTGESQTLDSGTPISAEGTNLVLEGSQLAPFSQFDLKGNTTQQTYTGKNLFNKNTVTLGKRIGSGGGLYDSSDGFASDYISANENTTYVVNYAVTSYNQRIAFYNSSKTFISKIESGSSFATPTDTAYIRICAAQTILDSAQLEKGSTSTSYEKFCGGTASPNPDYPQAVQVVTGENIVKIRGKNLLDLNFTDGSANGVSFTNNGDGTLTARGTTTGNVSYSLSPASLGSLVLGNGKTYTQRVEVISGTQNLNVVPSFKNSGDTVVYNYFTNNQSRTTSDTMTCNSYNIYASTTDLPVGSSVDFTIRVWLEEGSNLSSDFEPYQEQSYPISLGSLELCKIGTYQDYIWKDGDTWKVHKTIGKVVYNGTESNWSKISMTNNWRYYCGVSNILAPSTANDKPQAFCSHFTSVTPASQWVSLAGARSFIINNSATSNSSIGFTVGDSSDKLSDFKTWLSSNNVSVYYVYYTPTDTAIADAALIEQLDAIYNQAHAYKTRTYVDSSAVTGNVPHIIAATVVGSADGTVTNAGNIYSKPKLTVYGSGNIGIYLNGVQMFQITLGSDGYITIDTNLMEAYKDNLQTLKNRQVTGDYSNFKLPVGQSTISFSGIVTSCVVENFSRWL